MRIHRLFIAALVPAVLAAQKPSSTGAARPITFLDRQLQRDIGSPTPSPDGKWLLYTLSTPDWSQAKRQTDIYLVSVKDGLPSTRQMTFTKDKMFVVQRGKRVSYSYTTDAKAKPKQIDLVALDDPFKGQTFEAIYEVDEDTLKVKPYADAGKKQTALQNRDIIRLFDGLKVSESFLMKTNIREFLFRKPPKSQ